MHRNEQLSDTWFMPFRQKTLPPFTNEIKGFACAVALFIVILLCVTYLVPVQFNTSFGPSSINNELKNKATDKLHQNDMQGAMKILNHAIAIEKNKFNVFNPQKLKDLNQQKLDAQMLETMK